MSWSGQAASGRTLTIGLLNNTSDRALKSTERHFRNLLCAASPGAEFEFRLFTSPEIARSRSPEGHAGDSYGTLADLLAARLDALIVTGMEPQAKTLPDEPVWASLTKVADWAETRRVPVVWSCLAAHAAVLHLDGIARTPLPEKMFGVFECAVLRRGDPLTAALPSRWLVPHSRYHGLPESALATSGYQILSRSDEVGVDMFQKLDGAPSLFLQGHPEYQGDTLVLEYKRDVRRYVAGERGAYPTAPRNCFDRETDAILGWMRERVLRNGRDAANPEEVSRIIGEAPFPNPWRSAAVRLFAEWLAFTVADDPPGVGHAGDPVRAVPVDGAPAAP